MALAPAGPLRSKLARREPQGEPQPLPTKEREQQNFVQRRARSHPGLLWEAALKNPFKAAGGSHGSKKAR